MVKDLHSLNGTTVTALVRPVMGVNLGGQPAVAMPVCVLFLAPRPLLSFPCLPHSPWQPIGATEVVYSKHRGALNASLPRILPPFAKLSIAQVDVVFDIVGGVPAPAPYKPADQSVLEVRVLSFGGGEEGASGVALADIHHRAGDFGHDLSVEIPVSSALVVRRAPPQGITQVDAFPTLNFRDPVCNVGYPVLFEICG